MIVVMDGWMDGGEDTHLLLLRPFSCLLQRFINGNGMCHTMKSGKQVRSEKKCMSGIVEGMDGGGLVGGFMDVMRRSREW